MTLVPRHWLAGVVAAATLVIGLTAGPAVAEDQFYKGKTLTIVVGFSPGGGYDTYARALARYVSPHIPGNPTVIVQNMPGAGSLTSVRYLDTTAPKDGTVITHFNPGLITESLTNPGKIKMKFSDVGWVGSITRDFRVCYSWHTSPLKTWDDLAKAPEYILGATGTGTSNYVNGAILRNVLGLKVKQVTGFPGSAEMRLAIERGELQGDCGSWSSIPDDWIAQKKINTLVRFSPQTTPDMPQNVPYVRDLAKTEEQKRVLDIVLAAGELGRPFVVSKQVPADRLSTLRAAFLATLKDKGFLAEAKKQGLPVYPVSGEEAEKMIANMYSAPPELIEKAKAAVK